MVLAATCGDRTITYRPQNRSAASKWIHAEATVMVLENMRVIPGSCIPTLIQVQQS